MGEGYIGRELIFQFACLDDELVVLLLQMLAAQGLLLAGIAPVEVAFLYGTGSQGVGQEGERAKLPGAFVGVPVRSGCLDELMGGLLSVGLELLCCGLK